MQTELADSKIKNVSSAVIGLASPSTAFPPEELAPNPLNNTFPRDLFIALHIILVRIIPLAPTRDPATINRLFCMTNPAAQAAIPE